MLVDHLAQDFNCYPSDLTKLSVKSNLTYAEVSDEHFWENFFFKGIAIC